MHSWDNSIGESTSRVSHFTPVATDAEQVLQGSEQKFRALFEDSPVSMILHDIETGDIVAANAAACAAYGLSSVEDLRESHRWMEPPYSFEDALAWIRKTAVEGPQEFEWLSRRVTGEFFWEKVQLTVVFFDSVQRVLAIGIDITTQKEAEAALRAREQRFKVIMSSMQDIVFTLDREQRHTGVYGPWVEASGLTPEHFLGRTSREILGAESAIIHEKANDRALRGEFVVYEWSAPIGNSERHYQTSLSPIRNEEGSVQEIVGIGRDVTDRTKAQKQQAATHNLLEQVLQGTLDVIQQMTEARDPYTSGHQRRVAELAEAIAREMHLPEESCVAVIRTAAFIHDIGKITVPAEILSKPGQISPTEFELIKVHPTAGYNILRKAHLPDPVAEVVLQHHERLDGSGYPQQLAGDDILPEAQILAEADVVEAMLSHRPYRPAPGIEAALEEISSGRGTRYYPDVVDACLALFGDKGFSFSC